MMAYLDITHLSGYYSEAAKNGCMTAIAVVKKLHRSAVIFFYIGHTSTPNHQSQAM